MLRTVQATRYVTPLREGGSLPAIVEDDDLGLYVIKFRGAGQGPLALVSELIGGEIGRALGLPVPEIVFVEIDEALGRNEPDYEIRELLGRSTGVNLALDYLPVLSCSIPRPATGPTPMWRLAPCGSTRSSRMWTGQPAIRIFFSGTKLSTSSAASAFAPIRNHILLRWADEIEAADRTSRSLLNEQLLSAILDSIPDAWLLPLPGGESPQLKRSGYMNYFLRRLESSSQFVMEAMRARAELI